MRTQDASNKISMGSITDIYRNSTLCHDFPMLRLFRASGAEKPKTDRVYLDYASATPVLPEVLSEMLPFLINNFGNPSAVHFEGQVAKQVVTESRTKVARILGVQPEFVTFTSGGTESNNLAIIGVVEARRATGAAYSDMEVITTRIEHPATSNTFLYLTSLGVVVKYIEIDSDGVAVLADLQKQLSAKTLLVSVAYVNSEIGCIQDVNAIHRTLEKFTKNSDQVDIVLHVDAAQAPLWLPCELSRLGADLLSLDAGKFGGPKGIGVLVKRRPLPIKNIAYGGGQEGGLRPGTEPVAQIVGLASALTIAQNNWSKNKQTVSELRDYFWTQLKLAIPKAILNGPQSESRVANNMNISIPDIDSEFAVVSLDVAGIACSTKSACSSAGGGESTVVLAISSDSARAASTLRFTLGVDTTKSDIDKTVETLTAHVASIPKF